MATIFDKKKEQAKRLQELKNIQAARAQKHLQSRPSVTQQIDNTVKTQAQQGKNLYVPASPYTQENKKRQRLNYIVNPNYRTTQSAGVNNPYKRLEYLTEDERKNVTQFVAGKDYTGASKYLDSINSRLNSRVAEAESRKMKDFAKEHNVLGALAATMAGLYKPMGYVEGMGQTVANWLTGENTPIDYNSPAFSAIRLSEAASEGITEDKSGMEQFLWGVALSMSNQLATAPMGAAALPFMGLQGAADALYDYSKKGIDPTKALIGATGSGAITYATERLMPNERLFGLGDDAADVLADGALKHIFKSALGEGVEEIEENVIGNLWDTALMRENSDFSTLKNQLMEQGLTEENATKQALYQIYVQNSATAFAGGALSGGMLGGLGSGANYMRASRLGQQYNDPDTVQRLIEEGREILPGSAAEKLAGENRAKLEAKGGLKNSDVYRQVAANQTSVEDREKQQQRINISRIYSQSTGADGDGMVINSLQKIFSGGKLSNNEAEAIINDEFARNMFSNETGVTIPENATMSAKRRAVKGWAEQVARGQAQPVVFETPENAVLQSNANDEQALENVKRYGENGQKAFMSTVKGMSGEKLTAAVQDFENYYMAGTADLGMNAVVSRGGLDSAAAYNAYYSGVNDRRYTRKEYDSKAVARNRAPGFDYKGSVETDSATADNLDKVGKRFGVKITVVDNLGEGVNGRYNTKKGEFVLSASSEKSLDFIAMHELTHRLRQTSPKEFYDMGKKVLVYMQENKLLTGEAERQAKLYGLQEGSIRYDDMLEEVVADFIGGEYDLQTVVDMMSDQPKGFVQKVIDFITDIINSIKKAVGMDVQTDRLEEIRNALESTVRAGIEKNSENSYNEGSKLKETGYETTDRKRNTGTVEGVSESDQRIAAVRSDGSEEKGLERFSQSGKRSVERPEVDEDGISVDYEYTQIPKSECCINAKNTSKWLKKLGIEHDFFTGKYFGESEIEKDEGNDDEAATTVEGFVLIGANLTTRGKNTAFHEAIHSLSRKKDNRITDYVNAVKNNFNKESREGIEFIAILSAEGYPEEKLNEEVAAFFSGWIFNSHYGNKSDFCSNLIKKYSPAFKDFDAVLKTHNDMTHLLLPDEDIRYSRSGPVESDYTVSGQAVKELSKKLIGEYSANMKITELADKLAVVLDYMQEGFSNPDFNFDTAVDKIRSVAREMVESASVVSTEYGGEYLEVRDVIRGMKFYLDDKYKADLTGVENYGEFHKKYFGKLPLSKKGSHVDKAYLELNEMYPGLFPEDITHPAQQLEKIAEVYDKVNIVVNPYEGYEEDVAETITWQIYDAYFDMPSTRSEIERKQLETKLRVNRNKLKLSNAEIAKLKAEKRKLNRELLYKSQMADYFEEQLVNEVKSNKLVNEILDIATQFKTWYKGGRDVSYLKHPALENYIKELGKIKWRSDIRKASARKIMGIVNKFYTQDVLGDYYEQVVADRIKFVADNATKDDGEYNDTPLNLQELEAVNSVMKAIKKLYQEFDTVRIDGRRENTRELARKEYDILVKYGRSDVKTKFFNYLTNKLLTDGMFNAVESRVVYQALEGFHEEGVLAKLHDDMSAGVTKSNKLRIEMLRARDEYLEKHKDYRKRLENDKVTFFGKEMTVGQAITMYLTMHREEAQATLTSFKVGSGLFIRDKKGNVSEIQALTDVQRAIEELGKLLTKEDKEFARIARKIFNENARDVKMAADMDILGFTNVSESKNYIPIKRAGDQIAVAFSDVRRMVRDVASVYNFSFNKATVQHSEKGIEIFDINDLLDNHCGKVAMYAGLTKPLQNFDRVLNANITIDSDGTKYGEQNLRERLNKIWKPVQKGTNSVGGFHNFHSTLMQDVQSRGRGDSSRLVNRVKSAFASAALGANLKEIISQPTGYLMAYQYLSGEAMVKGAAMANDYDSMMKYSDYAMVRDYDKGYLLSESLTDKVDGFAKRFGEPLDWADKFTMGKLWNACRVEVELTHGHKVGTEENYKAAAELLEKVGRLTQPNYDASEKSAFQRNKNEIISSFSMFSSVQTKQLSRMIESVTKYYMYRDRAAKEPTEAYKKALETAKKEMARCNAGVLMMNAGYVLVCTLVKAALPKKEEEKITDAKDLTKKMVSGLIESYAGIIPFMDDAANMLFEGYDSGHFFYSSINDMKDALRGMKNFEKDPAKALYNLAVATGQLTGVPARNISNVLKGFINRGASFMDAKGEYEGTKLIFKAFGGEKKASYINLLYKALYEGEADTAKYIIDDMVKRGYTKSEISLSLKKLFAENAVTYWKDGDKENLQKVMAALNMAGLTEKNISSQIKTRQKNIIKEDRAITKLAKKLAEYRQSDAEYKQKHREELQAEIDRLVADYVAKGYSRAVVEAAIESLIE